MIYKGELINKSNIVIEGRDYNLNGESLLLLIIGIYLLISAYLIIFKGKLFTMLFGYTYRSAKLISDKSKLNDRLGLLGIGFGISFTIIQ